MQVQANMLCSKIYNPFLVVIASLQLLAVIWYFYKGGWALGCVQLFACLANISMAFVQIR
jgi:hypothetical protein